MKIGLKVTFKDPENPAGVINAQFATARSHPEMLELLRDIARKDVAESVAMQKLDNAAERLKRSDDPEAMQEERDREVERYVEAYFSPRPLR